MTKNNSYHYPSLKLTSLTVLNSGAGHYHSVIGELLRALAKVGVSECVISDEPVDTDNASINAHLAGLAELLAGHAGIEPPAWCFKRKYFLREPEFLTGHRASSALVDQTQMEFRKRLLFCEPVSVSDIFACTIQ